MIKILLLFLGIAAIGAIVFLWMTFFLMRRMLTRGARVAIEAAWMGVLALENPTLQVIAADKVLDEALHLLGYSGSLGEKLKQAGPRFKKINDVWRAHKLRNTVVHELSAAPEDHEVDQAIAAYHQALVDLGAKI